LAAADFAEETVRIDQERADATALWMKLEAHPHARRKVLVANSRKYQTWSLCDLLLHRTFELGFSDPPAALSLAELAVDVAERLDPDVYGAELVCDFRARALGYQANAWRINSDFRQAEASLAEGSELLDHGTGDILEEALFLRFEASLRNAQSRFGEAITLQRRAVRIYRRSGNDELAARAEISLGTFYGLDGKPERAVVVLRKTLQELEPQEPRWILGCRHNLILNLSRCGQYSEALTLLQETRQLYDDKGEQMILLKLRMLEAELARETGDPLTAERALIAACDGFTRLGIPFEAGFAALELSDLYLAQGRSRDAVALAGEIYETFEALDAPAEALAALAVLQQALQRDSMTAAVIAEVRSRLLKLHNA